MKDDPVVANLSESYKSFLQLPCQYNWSMYHKLLEQTVCAKTDCANST